MHVRNSLRAAGAALVVAASVAAGGPALAHGDGIAGERHDLMEGLGGAMRTLKQFVQGRRSAEEAAEAAALIAAGAPRIPSVFPPGSGREAYPESESKDAIWEQWDEFVAAADSLGEKTAAFQAALASGDTGRIGAAFGDLGKNGCGGCHQRFREKR